MIEGEARVTVARNVFARRFGEELVLLDFARGEYFGLDAVGRTVWEACAEGASVAAAATAVCTRFDVDAAVALADARELVTSLVVEGLVVPAK